VTEQVQERVTAIILAPTPCKPITVDGTPLKAENKPVISKIMKKESNLRRILSDTALAMTDQENSTPVWLKYLSPLPIVKVSEKSSLDSPWLARPICHGCANIREPVLTKMSIKDKSAAVNDDSANGRELVGSASFKKTQKLSLPVQSLSVGVNTLASSCDSCSKLEDELKSVNDSCLRLKTELSVARANELKLKDQVHGLNALMIQYRTNLFKLVDEIEETKNEVSVVKLSIIGLLGSSH